MSEPPNIQKYYRESPVIPMKRTMPKTYDRPADNGILIGNSDSGLKSKLSLSSGKIQKKNRHAEHDLQMACVSWFKIQYPKLRMRLLKFGADTNIGAWHGARLKKLGYLAGSPDLLLAVPGHANDGNIVFPRIIHGLFIELKIKGGSLSAAQKSLHKELGQDYKVITVFSFDEFQKAVTEYLK